MSMNYYSSETVKAGVTISQYLSDQGVPVRGNRAVATWRDGKRASVSIDDGKRVWHDFAADEGGDVISLAMKIEGGSFFAVCRELGDRYNLTPDKVSEKPKGVTRGESLVSQGYKLIATYTYQNEDGTPRYWVDRYERIGDNGKKDKEFVQRGPNAENLRGIEKTLYNLPSVLKASQVFVQEGEKDVDTMTRLGLVATTNSSGAQFWDDKFNRYLSGKDVVVMADNDKAGHARGVSLTARLRPVAKTIKMITISSRPKGDVTTWIEEEGGNLDSLLDIVAGAKTIDKNEVMALELARAANEYPLVNYEEIDAADGKNKKVRIPRRVDDICADMATRFLGFPLVIGSNLFDYTRGDPRKIKELRNPDELKAWVNGTSGNQSEFISGCAFANYKEVMCRLFQTRKQYDVISKAPWWPPRDDAFQAHEELPPADPAHAKFNEFLKFFSPATPADATLIKALFLATLHYTEMSHPSWIVDTVDAQGSGKTSVIKAASWLLGDEYIDVDLKTFDGDITAVKKRILSANGRSKRLALFDNVTTSLRSSNLASFITSEYICGMSPYGRGEETRRNDITWCITVNGASVDTDMATRSYIIHVKNFADFDGSWEASIKTFIRENRWQIFADMIDLLSHAKYRRRKKSRFVDFDSVVLSAACDTDAEFEAADEVIRSATDAANDDTDLAAQCVEAITNALLTYDNKSFRSDLPFVLRCCDVDEILRKTSGGVKNWTSKIVRRFVNNGSIKNIAKGIERIDTADGIRMFGKSRCFIFSPCESLLCDSVKTAQFVTFSRGFPEIVGVGQFKK